MEILVTGAGGQLGSDIVLLLAEQGHRVTGIDIGELDLTDENAVNTYFRQNKFNAVVHCAAYTAVDRAEAEVEKCMTANSEATAYLSSACKTGKTKLLYISTDYVFSGDKETPYLTEDEPAPANVYGKSKLGGELAVTSSLSNYFIIRISWVFGLNGNNFVKTMLRLGKENSSVNVVCDQTGSPTYTKDLAVLIGEMIKTDKYGIYHATNEGFCTWAQFAQEIFSCSGLDITVNKIPAKDYPTAAQRPVNSCMSKDKLSNMGFNRLPKWQDALARFLHELKSNP